MDTHVIDAPNPAHGNAMVEALSAPGLSPIPAMPPAIAKAVVAVCRSVRRLKTDGRNKHEGYNFASIDAFLEAVGGWCADAGLAILPEEVEAVRVPGEMRKNKYGDEKQEWTLRCTYRFWLMHESGAVWPHPLPRRIDLPAYGPQSYGSAESYVLKRFLRSLFMVPTGDALDPASDLADPDMMPRERRPEPARLPPRDPAFRREPPRDEAPPRMPTTNTAPEYRIYNGLGEVVGTHSDLAGWGSAIKAYLAKYPGAWAKNAAEISRIEEIEMSFPGLSEKREAALRAAFDSILAMQPKVGGEPETAGDPVR